MIKLKAHDLLSPDPLPTLCPYHRRDLASKHCGLRRYVPSTVFIRVRNSVQNFTHCLPLVDFLVEQKSRAC